MSEIAQLAERIVDVLPAIVTANELLQAENARLQEGIDLHLEKCAELRGREVDPPHGAR